METFYGYHDAHVWAWWEDAESSVPRQGSKRARIEALPRVYEARKRFAHAEALERAYGEPHNKRSERCSI